MTLVGQGLNYSDQINFIKTANTPVAVDTESGETRGMMGISVAFCTPVGPFYTYLPVRHDEDNLTAEQLQALYDVLSTKTLVFHNAVYDLRVLRTNGFDFKGKFYDTMLMCHWVNENIGNYSLDYQSKYYGGKPKNRPYAMQFIIDHWGWDHVPLSLMHEYSAHDALITIELFNEVYPLFVAQGFDEGDLWPIECKFMLIMDEIVQRGIKINPQLCVREILRGESVMRECHAKLGFNPGSRLGLQKLLLEELGLPVVEVTPNGAPSFNKTAMEQYDLILANMDDDRAKWVLKYRGWQITISLSYRNFLKYCDGEAILHPGYKLHGTVTGRMSCEKPNLQQIPRESEKDHNGKLKMVFLPREGFGQWEFDYSQLEFRLAAGYSEQEELLDVFNDPDPKRNLFREMSAQLGWPYDKTKTFNYSTMYGGGATNTARVFGVSIPEAKVLIRDYYTHYPKLRQIQRKAEALCKKRGWVQYWTGRRRHFPNRVADAHKAFNSIIQGGGAEVVKRAMVKLHETVCDENCYMVLQVHDSVVFEIRLGMESHYIPKIREAMEAVEFDFGVKFRVDCKQFGGGWEEAA